MNGVAHQNLHGADGFQRCGTDRFPFVSETDDDAGHAFAQIHEIFRQAKDGHDFRRRRDVEPVAPRNAVQSAAQSDDNVAQGTLIQINDAAQHDAAGVNAKFVAVLKMIVHHRREQIIGFLNGIHVADEMQIDVLRRHDLRAAAAGAAAFDAEIRAERRLTHAQHRLLPELPQRVGQTDGRGGFAFALRRRRHRRHQNQMSVGAMLSRFQFGDGNFGDVMAVWEKVFGVQAQFTGDF